MTTTISIADYMKEQAQLIEAQLDQLLPEQNVPYNQLYQAARYAVLGGGKKLRPILALATANMLGQSHQKIIAPVAALEMIHAYSLIHDDLPCMDDDDFRRGKPSLHKKFPEGVAVLTGDFLLTHAFEILSTEKNLSDEKKVQLTTILARASGGSGMVAGQIMDIASEGENISLEHLRYIHSKKTGALLTASVQFGAVLGNATDKEMKYLTQFGEAFGVAFQIVDDILDVTASVEKHGKAVGSDAAKQKTTYVTLLGIEKAQAQANELYEIALNALNKLDKDIDLLARLMKYILTYEKKA